MENAFGKVDYFLVKCLFPIYIYIIIVHAYLSHTHSYCVIMEVYFLQFLLLVSKKPQNSKTLFYNTLISDF